MPTQLVESGPELQRDNLTITPMATIHSCEGCGYVGAPFGQKRGDEVLSYCGWVHGQPQCIGKGRLQKEKPPGMTSVGSGGGFGGSPALNDSVDDRERQAPGI